MIKPKKPKKSRRDDLDDRSQDEDPPLTPEEARRELGFDLLPFNGTVREVDE